MKYLKTFESINDDYLTLARKIDNFIDKYAGIRPDYDSEYDDIDDKYTSPDAYEMLKCSNMLKANIIPDYCFSEWSSGGYKPINSEEGKQEHDDIIIELSSIKKK